MHLLSRPRRSRRAHEWSGGKAVTFIVTLAASRSVTLAARSAGMSRKSAYALKARDPAFAAAWNAAVAARSKGGEVEEVKDPSFSLSQGDSPVRAAPSIAFTGERRLDRRQAEAARDRFFDRLRSLQRESTALAHRSPAQ